jgi:glutamate carboxypeptidase
MESNMSRPCGTAGILIASLFFVGAFALPVFASPQEPVASLAAKEKAPFLDTLKELVSIESGSGDREGLDKISALIADRLKALGGEVEFIEPDPADIYRMLDTPKQIGRMVHARFVGTGTKKIMLIAHMDTVYLRGMEAQQPFRVDGNRAYGLGIDQPARVRPSASLEPSTTQCFPASRRWSARTVCRWRRPVSAPLYSM